MVIRNVAEGVKRLLLDTHRFLRFRSSQRRGVFKSFEEARGAAPGRKRLGYDHTDVAEDYARVLYTQPEAAEYAVLFHLDRVLRDGSTVLDVGGNVGIHFLQYQRYLLPRQLHWIIHDLPEMAGVGRRVCAQIPEIRFEDELSALDARKVDVFHASGTIEYLESWVSIIHLLIDRGLQPEHIMLNHVPLHGGPAYVTLQSAGVVCYPHHVFNQDEFVRSVTSFGYRLVDSWWIAAGAFQVPFHPQLDVPSLSGFCFSRDTPLTAVDHGGDGVSGDAR